MIPIIWGDNDLATTLVPGAVLLHHEGVGVVLLAESAVEAVILLVLPQRPVAHELRVAPGALVPVDGPAALRRAVFPLPLNLCIILLSVNDPNPAAVATITGIPANRECRIKSTNRLRPL